MSSYGELAGWFRPSVRADGKYHGSATNYREPLAYALLDMGHPFECEMELCVLESREFRKDSPRWAPTLDHAVPLSEGGEDHPSNLRFAHHTCNVSAAKRGKKQSSETIALRVEGRQMTLAENGGSVTRGRKHSVEHIAKRVAAFREGSKERGPRVFSEETRKKISEAGMGRKQSEETKAKRVASKKKTEAARGPLPKRVMSGEQKAKISEATKRSWENGKYDNRRKVSA